MPALKTYDLFVSHAWKYSEDYCHAIKLLESASNFVFRNYSVPEHNPVLDPDDEYDRKKLWATLDRQIKPVSCVLIISGMYVPYSYWIQQEIGIAVSYGKPIVGLIPRGAERIPTAVSSAAKEMVGWTTDSMVAAVRKHSIWAPGRWQTWGGRIEIERF